MSDNPKTDNFSNTQKDPDDWVSGDEPMTRCAALLPEDAIRGGSQAESLF